MSIELRTITEGHCECGIPHSIGYQLECTHRLICEWGEIEHADPRPDLGQIGHLMLITPEYVHALAQRRRRHHRCRNAIGSITEDDGRTFVHLDYHGKRWTWELFEAHWSDGRGPQIYLGQR